MTLVRYIPWKEINTLERSLNRLFDDLVPATLKDLNTVTRVPAAELTETDDAVILKLELPGMEAKYLDIQVTEDAVSISGERKYTTESEPNGKTRSEFYYGKFQRVIPLPAQIQNTKVTAEYKDGILNLNLPKIVEEKSKVVQINLEQN
ncbi:Hsp20/alpha crystallin family protein [Trichormus variabilis]|uniref:Molecular chaperone n=1 Tax=Trichormus variabilis SAG 1403-4b TaxID=447716 RepID=A0A3S1C039_ANAVA|nr:Hsp20/alpha crystallin family protein [Trichormus variabilis]MBD2629634.1 Hsp20/alpha crystallin family protein [Trichormus variabilis FACHB-164]RUS92948.1 molecular chaperone [Trichormus variabilis SAG 1403-4b]